MILTGTLPKKPPPPHAASRAMHAAHAAITSALVSAPADKILHEADRVTVLATSNTNSDWWHARFPGDEIPTPWGAVPLHVAVIGDVEGAGA